MRLLAISGSLRRDSYNSALLRAAADARGPDVEFVVWNGLGEIPAYDEDAVEEPHSVVALKREVVHADAVLLATPEYNASVPGALKNALDWVSRPFATNPLRSLPVAVIGASQGAFGAAWAQAELRRVLRTIGAHVVDGHGLELAHAQDAFDDRGRLRDPDHAAALAATLGALLERPARRVA